MTKTALITGCSTGIGASAARAFAEAGFAVWATMRDPAAGAALAGTPGVTVDRLDVTDPASVGASVERMLAAHGRIDVLVNNAGFGLFSPFETSPPEVVDRQFATNVIGVMNTCRAVLPTLRAQRSGVILNVTSIGGLTTMPFNSVYHATKFAVDGFSEALRYELDPLGVTVKVIAPGGVATPFAATALGALQGVDLGDYAEGVGKVMAAFQSRSAGHYSTPDDIAKVILEAATDGLPQVRYVAGADAKAMLEMREPLSDVEYVAATAQRFGL